MKRTLLLSLLLTAATSFAQDKDQIESTVEGIDAICLNIDSNSQLLLDFMYDHQWAYLYVDNSDSIFEQGVFHSQRVRILFRANDLPRP